MIKRSQVSLSLEYVVCSSFAEGTPPDLRVLLEEYKFSQVRDNLTHTGSKNIHRYMYAHFTTRICRDTKKGGVGPSLISVYVLMPNTPPPMHVVCASLLPDITTLLRLLLLIEKQ